MVEEGVIKQTGEKSFEAVIDPSEREQIQSKRKSQKVDQEYPNVTVRQHGRADDSRDMLNQDPDVDLDIE